MTNDDIVKQYREYIYPQLTYYREPLPITSGQGCLVRDAEGREYLDFFGGILTVSVGHCVEAITTRIVAQLSKLQHISTLYPTAPVAELAELLSRLTPGALKKSFFTNSGTEADEMAVLTAQVHTGATEIIALRHSYSGRSAMATALTGQAFWRASKALLPGIHHAHAPYCYRCPFRLEYPSCDLACARDIEELIRTETSGRVAAMIAEPILGVGGFIVPPREYFQVAAEIVRRNGGLFIADEVQTGWGRTGGKWFGIEQFGVVPDIMTSAKGMANGIPIGWTTTTTEVADSFRGATISTFGGNPVSCAAALATLRFIEEHRLLEHVERVGAVFKNGLLELREQFPAIGDVRGMGLMLALELVKDRKARTPDAETVLRIFEETRKEGLLIGKGGLYGNVLRLSPPMTVTESQVKTGLRMLKAGLAKATLA